MIARLARGSSIEVQCTVDLAQTPDMLHAHVDLCGVHIEPGDTVLVHEAPTHIPFGERQVVTRRATVIRAGILRRWWTRLTGRFEFSTLWDVGFSPDPLPATIRRRKP
jgi:hypothetical protein